METTNTSTESNDRAEFIAGLRALADHYENTPDLDLPYGLRGFVYSFGADKTAAQTKALGGKRTKTYSDTSVEITRDFGGGVTISVYASRHEVCERVVVGTKTVEREITQVVGTETVTEDVIEWRCTPLLDDEPAKPGRPADVAQLEVNRNGLAGARAALTGGDTPEAA